MHAYQTHQCIDRQSKFDFSSGVLSISHRVSMLHIRPIMEHGGVCEVGRESNRGTSADPESGGTCHNKGNMRQEADTPTRRRLQITGVQTAVCRSPGPGLSQWPEQALDGVETPQEPERSPPQNRLDRGYTVCRFNRQD